MASGPPTPPAGARADVLELRQSIEALSVHLRGVSDELAAERDAREKEAREGISILKLHVPMVVVITLVLFLGSAIAGGAVGSFKLATHLANEKIHLNADAVAAGDGVAYNRTTKAELENRASDLEAKIRLNAVAIKSGVTCRPVPGKKGETACTFVDPDVLPLRGPRFSAP